MSSLYAKLFRAGSADRDRREDFLTEALEDLLNRLSAQANLDFCEEFLLGDAPPKQRKAWLAGASRSGALIWKTQEPIAVGGTIKKPDMVLYRQSDVSGNSCVPLMIIECKITAPFTHEQLLNYDKWLSQQTNMSGALVLLTHLTDPPDEFIGTNGSYQSPIRTVRRWSDLYEWLAKELGPDADNQSIVAASLRAELLEFLYEEGLMTDEPTLQDVAAARIYLVSGAHRRLADWIKSVRKVVRSKFPNLRGWPQDPPHIWSEPDADYGGIVDWCELHKGITVGWGLYSGVGFWPPMEPPLPRSDAGCVWIEFGSKKVARPSGNKYPGWHFPTGSDEDGEFHVGKTVDLEELDEPTANFSAWVIEALIEAQSIIDDIGMA